MKHIAYIPLLALFVIIGAGCNPGNVPNIAKPGPYSWIDAPLPNSHLPLAQFEVVSHSTDPLHIAQVELSVNGAAVRTDPSGDSQKTLVTTKQAWTPPGPGRYTLAVRARGADGAWGESAQALVIISGGSIVQGTVYSDLNGDGLPNDPGDGPMDGVQVTLSGCASRTTTTVNGTFRFTGLPAGTCFVQVSKLGWKPSGTHPAGLGDPAKVTSEPAKPTALSIFITPLATRTPTPAPAVPIRPGSPTPLPPVTIAFFADQLTLESDDCTTIHWQVKNASQVFLDDVGVDSSGSKEACPAATEKHSLRVVTLDNQTVQRSLTLTVVAPPPITITPTHTPTPAVAPPAPRGCTGAPNVPYFSASPEQIYVGQSATLSWGAVTNADSVEIDQGIGGVGTPGSTAVSPTGTTTYTLTAHCGSNIVRRQATVTVLSRGVVPPPAPRGCTGTPNIASFTASSSTFVVGEKITLSWGAVTNADSVEIDQGIGGVATPGSTTVSPTGTTTYTLTAHCGSNTATRQVTVTITRIAPPPFIFNPPTPTQTRTFIR